MIGGRTSCSGPLRRTSSVFLLIGLMLASSCATTRKAESAEEAWKLVLERRRSFVGARSYMKVRVQTDEARWRFNARVLVDGEGRMVMSGLSPMGTAVFTLNLEHDRVVLQDHHEKTVWEGSPEDLPEVVGIQGSFSTRLLPFLLLGLPPSTGEGEVVERIADYIRIESGRASIVIGRSGPIETRVEEGRLTIRATYTLPSMPPSTVTIETEGQETQRVEVTHLDLSYSKTSVPEVEINPSYRRLDSSPGKTGIH